MANKECAYYAELTEELGDFFTNRYSPCQPNQKAIGEFVAALNEALATEPNAISAHLKAMQKTTGCVGLATNLEQSPHDLKDVIQTMKERGNCHAVKYFPKKIG